MPRLRCLPLMLLSCSAAGVAAGKRSSARALHPHLQTPAGRLANCARSYVGGCEAEVICRASVSDAGLSQAFHRNVLQFAQPHEKLLVDVIESAVTKNNYHVFWLHHGHNSVHNGIGVTFVKRGPAGLSNRSHNSLWI